MTTRRALAFSFLDRYASLLLSIVSSMIIARLLTPTEMGVFSVTMVLVNLISAMRDLGAGQYLLQESELTIVRQRATWTVLLSMGFLMALIVLALAYPAAKFYNEPTMVAIMWVTAFNFALNPFGSLTYAWLMREMRFDSVAIMRFSSGLAGACTSVLLAWYGTGPISLAYGSLAATIVNAAIGIIYRPVHFDWRPGFAEISRVIGFGSKISATSLIANFTAGFPELALGKLQSLNAAGLFSRGNGLAAMFHRLVMDATNSVALPLFAKTQRDQGTSVEPWLKATAFVTALGWTFLGGLALFAFPVTRLLYGSQWDDSVVVAQIICAGLVIGLPAGLCPQLLIGTGNATSMMMAMSKSTLVQLLAVSLGAYFGMREAAIALALAQFIGVTIWLVEVRRAVPFRWSALIELLLQSAKVACTTLCAPLLCVAVFGFRPASPIPVLALASILGTLIFYFAAKSFKHPLYDEIARVIHRMPWKRHSQPR